MHDVVRAPLKCSSENHFVQAVRRGASEDIDLNELRVDEGLEGVPDLALFFIDCEHCRACGLRFDDEQAQTFTPFVHPLSRHCGEADYALARSMRAARTRKVFL